MSVCTYVAALITERGPRPACAAQLLSTRTALLPCGVVSGAGADALGAAAQPRTGEVADQIANTPRNGRVRPARSCYSYCMISPIRGDRTGFRVQVPPRTRFRIKPLN